MIPLENIYQVLVDVDPKTFNINPQACFEKRKTRPSKIIIHIFKKEGKIALFFFKITDKHNLSKN
jgi:dTDP-4-amino-4,6-dideoxygalactose transaminase